MTVERFIRAKELRYALESFGIPLMPLKRAEHLIAAMRKHGMPVLSAHMVRPSDAYAFLLANPEWKPYSKKQPANV